MMVVHVSDMWRARQLGAMCLSVLLLAVTGTYSPTTEAVRPPTRAINKAVQVNVRNAVERLQLRLKVEESSGRVVVQQSSLDGRYMLLVYEDNELRVLDFLEHDLWEGFLPPDSNIVQAAISPVGDFITAQSDGTLSYWRLDGAKSAEASLRPNHGLAQMLLHGADNTFMVLSEEGSIHIYPSGLLGPVLDVATVGADVDHIAVDRTGSFLAAHTDHDTVQVWEIDGGLPVESLDVEETSSALAFSRSSSHLFAASDTGVREWNLKTGAETRFFPCEISCSVSDLMVNELAGALVALTQNGVLLEWRLDQPEALPVATQLDEGIERLATTPAAPLMVLGLGNGLIRFQHLEDGAGSALTLASSSRGWAMLDSTGRFDGTLSLPNGISWEGGGYTFPLTHFVEDYFEPGLFGKWVNGAQDEYLTAPSAISEGVLPPPSVTIELGGEVRAGGRLSVTVTREDNGGGLGELFLFHQGLKVSPSRIQASESGLDAKVPWISETFEVFAMPGTNTFHAKTRDNEGLIAPGERSSLFIPLREQKSTLHMLAVAIDEYDDPLNQLDLNYAVADANGLSLAVEERASELFDGIRTRQILNQDATRHQVLAALDDLKRAAPEDTVVIYFATHGEVLDETFHLLLRGLQLPLEANNLEKMAISVDALSERISALDARRVFLLLDTCKSGDAISRIATMGRDQRALQLFSTSLGVHLIAATGKGQNALEVNTLGHGVFTHTLLNALRGEADGTPFDQIVTAEEIGGYTQQQVMALTRRLKLPPQSPTVFSQGFDFKLGVVDSTAN